MSGVLDPISACLLCEAARARPAPCMRVRRSPPCASPGAWSPPARPASAIGTDLAPRSTLDKYSAAVKHIADSLLATMAMNYYLPCAQADKVIGFSPHSDSVSRQKNLKQIEHQIIPIGQRGSSSLLLCFSVDLDVVDSGQRSNLLFMLHQGYESREVAEEKWRRHGRKWRNFLVITTLLLFIVGCVLLHLGRATSLEL